MTHEDALLAAIEAREGEIVALTQALIRIPTVNPPGEHYRDCAELIGERLRAARLRGRVPARRGHARRQRPLSAQERHRAARGRRRRALACTSTATSTWWRRARAGPGRRSTALVEDGRVYGRGACDMKGGLAAAIVAVEALIDSGAPLPGAIEISGTVDEESGGYGGVAWLAERGWFSKPRVDHVIIPEPLNVDRVCIGHRGVWWAEIETKGRIAHGSMPFLGDCAVRHMAAVLDAFETRALPGAGRASRPPCRSCRRARATPTLNINSIHGGQPDVDRATAACPAPCVPDSCRLVFDRRLLIEEDIDEVKAEVRALLDGLAQRRPGFRYSLRDLMEVRPVDDRAGPAGGARRGRGGAPGAGPRGRSSSARPAPTTRSTSTASAICATASPTAPASSTSPTSPTSTS